jgi:hypothetical protein
MHLDLLYAGTNAGINSMLNSPLFNNTIRPQKVSNGVGLIRTLESFTPQTLESSNAK